jgi:hypothetical protein
MRKPSITWRNVIGHRYYWFFARDATSIDFMLDREFD